MKNRRQLPPGYILQLVGFVAVVLVLGLFVRRLAVDEPAVGGGIARLTDLGTQEADCGHDGSDRREGLRMREEERRAIVEERQAALGLAKKIGEGHGLPRGRMLLKGEEPIPSPLVKEAAEMKALQFGVLVRELGNNPEIAGSNKALLVALVTDAWLKENEAGRTHSLRVVLEIISEVLPKLPPGYDTLPVSSAMGISVEWDHAEWTDFLQLHWTRWSGPNGNPNAEVMRRDLLNVLVDPQLRMRVENLPQAGMRD